MRLNFKKIFFSLKSTILLVVMLFSLTKPQPCYSQAPSTGNGVQINCRINGVSGGKAKLIGIFGDQYYLVDSTAINTNGEFEFRREELYNPGLVYVQLSNESVFSLLLDKDQQFNLTANASNLIESMQIEGSIDNELLYENLIYEEKFQRKFKALTSQEEINKLVSQRNLDLDAVFLKHPNSFYVFHKKAGQRPKYTYPKLANGELDEVTQLANYKSAYWDNIDFSDERLLYTSIVLNTLQKYMTELTVQTPDSIIAATKFVMDKVGSNKSYYKFISNWIALYYDHEKTTVMDSDAIVAFIIKTYFTADKAFWLNQQDVEKLQERADYLSQSNLKSKGADIKGFDSNGQLKSIYGLNTKYKVVYLYSPSIDSEEHTEFLNWLKSTSNDVSVFGICTAVGFMDETGFKKYVSDNGLNAFTNIFDLKYDLVYYKYTMHGKSAIYILDSNNIIIGKDIVANQIDDVIKIHNNKD